MDYLNPEAGGAILATPMQRGLCELRTQHLGGCAIARLAGEVDISNASELQNHLSALVDHCHVVIDLSSVDILDSSALSVLTAAHRLAQRRRTSVQLAGATGMVRKVLRVGGRNCSLNHYAEITDAVEAALEERDEVTREGPSTTARPARRAKEGLP